MNKRNIKAEFETSKGKFSFMKLPQSTTDIVLEYDILNFETIGFVKDLTEKQWSKVVDSRYYHSNRTGISNDLHYENYNDKTGYSDFKTAKESGKSLMDSLNVYLENPYWIDSSYKNCNGSCLETVCSCDLIEKWENAEEKTGNWLLIKYL